MPVLLVIVLVDLIGFGLVIPLLPFYGQHFGASPLAVTMLMATYSLFQLFTAPMWGRLSDRHGRRPILLVSLAGSVASYIWLGLADALWMLFAARALQGFMAGNIAAAQAYVADVTTPENRARGMGKIGAAFGFGFIIGPAVGGLLAGSDPHALDTATPAFVGAVLSAAAFLGTLFALPESLPPERRGTARPGRMQAIRRALASPALAPLILVFACVVLTFAALETTFAIWAYRQYGWGASQVGWLLTYLGLVSALVQGGLIGRLTRRMGEERVLRLGLSALVLGLLLFPLAAHLPILLVASGIVAFGMGLTQPSLNSLISRRAGRESQGETLGVSQSTGSLARVIGPAIAGGLFDGIGRNAPYIAGAILLGLVLLGGNRLIRPAGPELAADGMKPR